jgi:PKD domain-containing protein
MRARLLLGATAVAAALAVVCAQAGAIVVETPTGRVSYAPQNAEGPSAGARSAEGNLTYHGGPVMHTNRSYAIFWDPASALPAGYATLISRYLGDVAGDSGLSTNVYSVGTQYFDAGGRAGYLSTFGGSLADGGAYPPSGCPVASGFTTCLTDAQLQAELESFVTANSLPRGLGALYHVFLPAPVDLCLSPGTCFHNFFCAYHGFTESPGSPLVYAALPYAPRIANCVPGEHPNSAVSSTGDEELNGLSHEANEAITDPLLNAWFDADENENADKCRNTGDDYGTPLGGGPGSLFNQVIGGDPYFVQREWGNGAGACEQRNALPAPVFTPPPATVVGGAVSFSGVESADSDGGITGYAWDFGDGTVSSGASASHSYTVPGTFNATLTVTDVNGFSASVTHPVSISAPAKHRRKKCRRHRRRCKRHHKHRR